MNPIRHAILVIAMLAGAAPAFAQAPAPVPALPDAERRTSYSISGTTCTCSVGFALYGDGTDYQNWVEVFINGARVNFNDATNGWTITSPSGSLSGLARPITNAVLTFTNTQTGTIQIVGARRPRRLSNFSENRGVPARDLNQILNDMLAQTRESWDKTSDQTGRTIQAPPGETLTSLASAASRANQFFIFDANGNPSLASPSVGLGNVIGPGSSVNNHVAVFSGISGTVIADGGSIGSTTLTGDVTGSGTVTFPTTLATVNGNVGTFGDAANHLQITVNSKGLITAASSITPALTSFNQIAGQIGFAQLPSIANNSILANNTGGTAAPTSGLSPSVILDMMGSTQGQILYRDAGGWQPLAPGTSGQLLSSGGAAANPAWITAAGTGTVTSVANDGSIKSSIASNGAITATGTLGLWGGPGDITNCTLAGTVSGGALTVALKGQNGSDPSASNPCIVAFRNATIATGDYTYVQATAATSFVTATSGSTFGSSNSTAFRLWITAWNNAGTIVLGVSKQSSATAVFPLNEGNVQSSTACNACGTATSGGVFYTTAAQTSKAIRILGYMDWGSGLATAGTFASGPTTIQMMGPGVKKPGDVMQTVAPSFGTVTLVNFTALTPSNVTASIAPTSAANLVRYSVMTTGGSSSSGSGTLGQVYRGSTAIGALSRALSTAPSVTAGGNIILVGYDAPGTTSSTTYVLKGTAIGGGTGNIPAVNTDSATEILEEIMG